MRLEQQQWATKAQQPSSSDAAVMDDDTLIALAGCNITWATPARPLSAISPNGVEIAAAFYSSTAATVTGIYFGVAG